jgi:hypothetical protein
MQYMDWYNQARPHSGVEKKTPDEAYAVMLPAVKLAAWESAEIPLKKLGPLYKRAGQLWNYEKHDIYIACSSINLNHLFC